MADNLFWAIIERNCRILGIAGLCIDGRGGDTVTGNCAKLFLRKRHGNRYSLGEVATCF